MMPSTEKCVVLSDNQQACLFSSYSFNACTPSQHNWLQAQKGIKSGAHHTWLKGNCTDDTNFASTEPSAQHPPPYFPTIHHCIITLIKSTGVAFVAFSFHLFLQPAYNVLLRYRYWTQTDPAFSWWNLPQTTWATHHPPDKAITQFRHWWRKQQGASIICKGNPQWKIANLPDSSRTTPKISLSCCIIPEAVSRSELLISPSWKSNCSQLNNGKRFKSRK
jgi:hypothetical protein